MKIQKIPLPALFAIRISIAAGISALAYWKMGGMVAAILSLPVWGALLAKPIVDTLETYFDFARKQPYARWQGHYYEFQSTHIRVFEINGILWFCDSDILKVLGKTPDVAMQVAYSGSDYCKIEDTGLMAFSETAVLRVISRIRHPETGKLKFWLEREVIAPFKKKQELKGLSGRASPSKKA